MNYGKLLTIIFFIVISVIIYIIYATYPISKINQKKLQTELIKDISNFNNINVSEEKIVPFVRYMRLKVQRGYKINLSIVKVLCNIYKTATLKNWYTKNIGIPKHFFLSLLIDEESVKEKNVLELIEEIFKKPQNIRDNLANGYDVILYHKIYDYLQYKFNLKEYTYDKDKISKILNTKFEILDMEKDGIKNGIYNDGSFIYHENVPYNLSYLSEYFESIFYIRELEIKNKQDIQILNYNIEQICKCLIPFIYGHFLNYNGFGRAISRSRTREVYKNLLRLIYLYNPNIKDYKYFDNTDDYDFYNIDKMYLLKVSGFFVWYGRNYNNYIINFYPKNVDNEVSTITQDGDLVITDSNYSHSILFGDEDLHSWYANHNKHKDKVILAGCIVDNLENIIKINGVLSYYDKIQGINIKALKIISDDLIFYYIINRNLSMISVVIINLNKIPYFYYPISIYQNDQFIASIRIKEQNIFGILSTLKPRYVKLVKMLTEKNIFEINTSYSLNNFGRYKVFIGSLNNIMHISTKEIKYTPNIIIDNNNEPIYTIVN